MRNPWRANIGWWNRVLLAGMFLFCDESWGAEKAFLKIIATQPGISEPVFVRAIIRQSNGSIVSGEWGNSDWPPVAIQGKAMGPGTVVEVATGETSITVGKGPDYLPLTMMTNLAKAGELYTVRLELEPALDLYGKGWRSGDAHVHYFHGDGQVSRSPEEAFAICAAGGMNFASFAEEHFGATRLKREETLQLWRAYETAECQVWMGAESPKSAWGHHAAILYDPWSIRNALPYNWGIQSIHAQGGVSFPVHPERRFPEKSFAGQYALYPLNNHLKFMPMSALTGHLLDGWSGISDQPFSENILEPYLKLLEMGYRIPLLADSDFCMDRANNGLKGTGFWMNYFHLEGNELSRAAVCNAIRQGRVMCTTGPLVLFTIEDQLPGEVFPADGMKRRVRIEASHRFNPWTLSTNTVDGSAVCKIASVELLRNGEMVQKWTPDSPEVVIDTTVVEDADANYMVRVLGNEGVWMAGYSSPIYFATEEKAGRQPAVFKALIRGRVYDAESGLPVQARISSERYEKTDWTIETDPNGLFQARVPIDAELVARDEAGRELRRNWMNYEPAYAFGHYLPDNYSAKGPAVDDFTEIVREMRWEFPMGFQSAGSYVKMELDEDAEIEGVTIVSVPEPFPEKRTAEVVMLLIDKTEVGVGDEIHYVAIFRVLPGSDPAEELLTEWKAWHPDYPRMYTKHGVVIEENNHRENLIELGENFFMRRGTVAVPNWAANVGPTMGGLKMTVKVRGRGVVEEAYLTVPIGTTKRELLVSTTWDGFPAAWGERGIGPCKFSRESTYQVRYADYREMEVEVTIGGEVVKISPKMDTAHVADTDDAIFLDHFYYDSQCEPEYRNIPVRDEVREQPEEPNFSEVPIVDPPDATGPTVALMEPFEGAEVKAPVTFYYFVDDAGLSGASNAVLFIDDVPVATNLDSAPVRLDVEEGLHTWKVEGFDAAGNSTLSVERSFTVVDGGEKNVIRMKEPGVNAEGRFHFLFEGLPRRTYLVEKASALNDWRVLLRTNSVGSEVSVLDPNREGKMGSYRVKEITR